MGTSRHRSASTRDGVGPVLPATADRIVDVRGRAKAYRPLPVAAREAALERGLVAYGRGAFYLAHEELEPAWMGTADAAERELLAGLIKLAAAFVHAARGNAAGVRTNLRGARERLRAAGAAEAAAASGLDVAGLIDAIDARLAAVDAILARAAREADDPAAGPVPRPPDPPHDVAGPAGRARRPPLDLDPPPLSRRTTA
jgi:predicted metal-dependent hydrolase